jgi:iron(III) transport system permease protein
VSIATSAPPRPFSWFGSRSGARADPGRFWLWGLILLTAVIVVPPMLFLLEESLTVELGGEASFGLDHYAYVLNLSGWSLWRVSLIYAIGSACFALAIGVSSAWLVARTNAYFRQVALVGAYLSLAAPVMVKSIGWILLLGPNKGVINEWLRALFATDGVPVALFTLTGMTLLEGLLWVPIVFLSRCRCSGQWTRPWKKLPQCVGPRCGRRFGG